MTWEVSCADEEWEKIAYPVEIAVGEETRAARNGRPAALPAAFGRIFERCIFSGRRDILAYDLVLVFGHNGL